MLGHPVRYRAIGAAKARAGIVPDEPGAWQREGVIELFGLYGSGAAAAVTGDLPRLLRRSARSLDDYLTRSAAAVRAAEHAP